MDPELSAEFNRRFDVRPSALCKAPGRVNIIGEHVDYMGFSVLPIAITQSIRIAATTDDQPPALVIQNLNPTFPPLEFETWDSVMLARELHWTRYVIAGILGVLEWKAHGSDSEVGQCIGRGVPLGGCPSLLAALPPAADFRNLRLLVDSDLPMAAGLSSSSALVCASVAVAVRCWRFSPPHDHDTELYFRISTKAEKHVGTCGGGMDHAVICGAAAGRASLVHFDPFRVEHRRLPPGLSVVIANSFSSSEKCVTAATNFNKRVFECKLAARILERFASPSIDAPTKIGTLKSAMKFDDDFDAAKVSVKQAMQSSPFTKGDVETHLGIENIRDLLAIDAFADVWKANHIFEPQRRAMHVYSEAARVHRFVEAASSCDYTAMGALINESDDSLVGLYDAGSRRLSTVTRYCRDAGALGARMTGAGWGGCCIALVKNEEVPSFMMKMSAYYKEFRKSTTEPLAHEVHLQIPEDDAECFMLCHAAGGLTMAPGHSS